VRGEMEKGRREVGLGRPGTFPR